MKELIAKYVGKEAYVKVGTMEVNVLITDIKSAYGTVRYQVSPVNGYGSTWVQEVRLIEGVA